MGRIKVLNERVDIAMARGESNRVVGLFFIIPITARVFPSVVR